MDQADKLRQMACCRRGYVIAVLSGKGGVGKTNISLSLSLLARRSLGRVLLWDCDFSLANCDILLDLETTCSIVEVFQGKIDLSEAIVSGPGGIDVLPGGSGVKDVVELNHKGKMILTKTLKRVKDQYDLVVIDSAAGIGENVIRLALSADIILLATNPEVTSVADAYATLKVLVQSGRKRGIELLVNMAADRIEAEKITGRIASVAQRFLDIEVKSAGWIPYDVNVSKAVKAREPFLDYKSNSPAARSMDLLWNRIEPVLPMAVGGAV